jgi:predicted transcriptional regulator
MSDQELLPEEYLKFFKAMADANRLRILGLLAMEPLSVEQLAAMLKLKPSTVSHHLAKLADVNLVSAKAYSYYNIYQLENSTLESMASQLLSREALPTMAEDIDLDAYDRKVLADYSTPDGKLKNIPAQRKKLDAVLNYIIQSFEIGKIYSEPEVNAVLANYHDDTATLRRELVGARLLARSKDGREYWRVEEKI